MTRSPYPPWPCMQCRGPASWCLLSPVRPSQSWPLMRNRLPGNTGGDPEVGLLRAQAVGFRRRTYSSLYENGPKKTMVLTLATGAFLEAVQMMTPQRPFRDIRQPTMVGGGEEHCFSS